MLWGNWDAALLSIRNLYKPILIDNSNEKTT